MNINTTQNLLNNLHKGLRQDSYVKELCKSTGIEMDNAEMALKDIKDQFSFSTMTWAIDLIAAEMGILIDPTAPIDDRRSILASRWKGQGNCNLELIQSVCNSWKNGEIETRFRNGHIELKFIGEQGIPNGLDDLKKQLEVIKPAHLIIDYLFRYLLIEDIHEKLTIDDMQALTLDKFAG